MRRGYLLGILGLAVAAGAVAGSAFDASAQGRVRDMVSNCRFEAATRLGGDTADATAKYQGQRVDGTHAVNGTIRLRRRSADFQCSYGRRGIRLVDFWTNMRRPPAATQWPPSKPSTGTKRIRFRPGASGAVVTDRLEGGGSVQYLLDARSGQFLDVTLNANRARAYFNIFSPDGRQLYSSSASGNRYYGRLEASGDHRIEIYFLGRRQARVELDVNVR